MIQRLPAGKGRRHARVLINVPIIRVGNTCLFFIGEPAGAMFGNVFTNVVTSVLLQSYYYNRLIKILRIPFLIPRQ